MKKDRMRWLRLLVLASGAGIIFQLPYLRYAFYTQLQDALGFTHLEYGMLMSVYAIVGMISYVPGGWLADRVSSRLLLSGSLVLTGITGFYFSTFPSYYMCLIIHGVWGLTTILTYWSALLKVTRTLGDEEEQGRLFGLLEGGRGIMSALGAYIVLGIFAKIGSGTYGMSYIIRIFSIIQILNGIITWLVIKDPKSIETKDKEKISFKGIISLPEVWLLSGLIFTAYSLYAGLSYVSPYLQDVFGASEEIATGINIFQRYVMMFFGGAVGGFLADKIGSRTKVLQVSLMISIASLGVIIIFTGLKVMMIVTSISIVVMAGSVYALRGLYFSITEELGISLNITGTVIGFASLIGYLPDVFIYPLIGTWLDSYPGKQGYTYMFLLLFVFAAIGLSIMFIMRHRLKAKNRVCISDGLTESVDF